MPRNTEELLKDAEEAIATNELDYSICLDGGTVVNGQKLNILILSENKKIVQDLDSLDETGIFRIHFSEDEYSAAIAIQEYRPDYIIVDCSIGKKRTGFICNNIFNDIRIPVVRIILSSKSKNIKDYCDKEVFGWIRKPFNIGQLNECIKGVPK